MALHEDISLTHQPRLEQELAGLESMAPDDEFGGTVYRYASPVPEIEAERREIYQNSGVRQIMEMAGYVFVGATEGGSTYWQTYLPGPERTAATARHYEVPVTFIAEASDEGKIPAKPYAAAVLSGTHPVGVNNLELWDHDTGAHEHILGPIVGGRDLMTVMADTIKESMGLPQDFNSADLTDELAAEVSVRYDRATNNLKDVVLALTAGDAQHAHNEIVWASVMLCTPSTVSVFGAEPPLDDAGRMVDVAKQLERIISQSFDPEWAPARN